MLQKIRGFSLIELMIAVAIVGILAAIAGGSYRSHVVKSNRVECQTALKGLASALERWRSTNGTYVTAHTGGVPNIYAASCPVDGGTQTYTLSISTTETTATFFRIQATAVGGQLSEGGGNMDLSSTGVKRWDKNRDGDFSDAGETSWEE